MQTPGSPRKILVLGPAWVGDMVMSQTLYQLLKQQDPTVVIDVMAPPATAPLLALMPEVHKTIPLPARYGSGLSLKQRYQIAKNLRAEGYDTAILLPNSFMSALIPFFARIPNRIGWTREGRFILLTDSRRLNKQTYPLMIERFMALGLPKKTVLPKPYPRPQFVVDPHMVSATCVKLGLNPTAKPILAICPGAEFGPSKRWPEDYYAKVVQTKLAEGWQVWIFGSKKDQEVAAAIKAHPLAAPADLIDLTGRTNLLEAVDLLSSATQVLSNDSGLMHISAALGKPLVVVYGSTDPRFTPPLSDQVKILRLDLPCSPCFERVCPLQHFRCMKDLQPELILEALAELERISRV
jgi:heptosyltransferase-2